jgi:hypothetical protein
MTTHAHLLALQRFAAAALTTLTLSTSVWAISDAQFQPARAQFLAATLGNEAAIEKSVSTFAALLEQEPANPVLMAYSGAATTLQATTTLLPWKKMRYAEDGLAQLDKALTLLTPNHNTPAPHGVPAALEVRFTAASTFLAVPGFMNRGARGTKLLGEVLASPLLPATPAEFRGTVWMRAAELAAKDKRNDDARRFYNEVIQANAPQAPAARAQLQALQS